MLSQRLKNLPRLTGADNFAHSLRRLRFLKLQRKYRGATMIGPADFLANLDAVDEVTRTVDGAIVECGTWKGGMAAAMMEVAGPDREYHFLDSFEGLPPARNIDGASALAWQKDTSSDFFYNNCTASVEEFREVVARTGVVLDRVHVHKGFFEQTLPGLSMPPIAVLRLDADWYDSTMICLEHLFDKIVPGGALLIDDYYTWDGCSRAVHDFLSRHQRSERIRQRSDELAVIYKEAEPPAATP
jgi:hypothetical protein